MDKLLTKISGKTLFVTGCAGFIGSHLSERLLKEGAKVIGIDNFDSFYPREMKMSNMESLMLHQNFSFHELDLRFNNSFDAIEEDIDVVLHLAGKAGVRPSIEDPQSYIDNNITATNNVLNFMVKKGIKKMAFASSSSLYGNNVEVPFTEEQLVDNVISPYAFTKKSCEVLNHNYHHLYDLDIVNMRFFTVFGPRQRPDLAICKFLNLMKKQQPIPVFGNGETSRDYTYIDDTVEGIFRTVEYLTEQDNVFETINLGNNSPVALNSLIEILAKHSGIEPIIDRLPMQPGDVTQTFADISKAEKLIGYRPKVSFEEGIRRFVAYCN